MEMIQPEPAIAERVAAEIRRAILDGNLAPSSRIKQEDLAARLGVSREPIRYAIVILGQEGLLQTTPNRGAIVAPLDWGLINDIYEFREAIESYVAAKVAARKDFDPRPLRAIIEAGRAAVHDGDLRRLIELDHAFHDGLYQAAGNQVVIDVMRSQWGHIRRAIVTTLTMSNYRSKFWDEHDSILEAIVRGNESRASLLATAHIRGAREMLAEVLS